MTQKTQTALTPIQALSLLKQGNQRFLSGDSQQRDYFSQVMLTASGQFPLRLHRQLPGFQNPTRDYFRPGYR